MADAILSRPGLTALRVAPHDQILVQARPGDAAAIGARVGLTLPETMLRSARTGAWSALHLAPDDWLLVADGQGMARGLLDRAGADGPACSLVEVSDRSESIDLSGSLVADLLAGGCPLDPATLADGGCSYTVFGKATILLWRRGEDYRIGYARSFDEYVTTLLTAIADDLADEAAAAPGSIFQ